MRVLALLVIFTIFSTASAGDGYCYDDSADNINEDCNCEKTSGESEATACAKISDTGAECKVHWPHNTYCAEKRLCSEINCSEELTGYEANPTAQSTCTNGCTLSYCCRETCKHAVYGRTESVCSVNQTPKNYENSATVVICNTYQCNDSYCCESISRSCGNWPDDAIWSCKNGQNWQALTGTSGSSCKTSCEQKNTNGCCWYKPSDGCHFKPEGDVYEKNHGVKSSGRAVPYEKHCDDWRCPAGKKNDDGVCNGPCNEDKCCQLVDECSEWRCPIGWGARDIACPGGRVNCSEANCCGETCKQAVADGICDGADKSPKAGYRGITCPSYACTVNHCCTRHRR